MYKELLKFIIGFISLHGIGSLAGIVALLATMPAVVSGASARRTGIAPGFSYR